MVRRTREPLETYHDADPASAYKDVGARFLRLTPLNGNTAASEITALICSGYRSLMAQIHWD